MTTHLASKTVGGNVPILIYIHTLTDTFPQVRMCGKIASKVSGDPTIKFHCPTAYIQPYLITVKKENTSLEDDPM